MSGCAAELFIGPAMIVAVLVFFLAMFWLISR